ncbi:uncharacterized protein FFFS_15781 [Fusarium fujikuroi]|nr:uncharacterized protein FFFS_15781 [Fusarium fujikuroi]
MSSRDNESLDVGYACSNHQHVNWDFILPPGAIPLCVPFLGDCEYCDGKITDKPVQKGRMVPIANVDDFEEEKGDEFMPCPEF